MKLTPEPLRGDVLQQSERDAEESDEQVADGQRANKNICRRLYRPFLHNYVDDQTVSSQSHDKNNHIHDHEGGLGTVRQLGYVDERLDVVSVDELLAAQVVVLEHLLQQFRSYLSDPLTGMRRSCCHPDTRLQPRDELARQAEGKKINKLMVQS